MCYGLPYTPLGWCIQDTFKLPLQSSSKATTLFTCQKLPSWSGLWWPCSWHGLLSPQVFQRIFASSKILKHVEWTVYGLHLLPIMSTVYSFQILQVRVGWRWWVKETFYWTIQIHSSNIFFKTMDQFGGLQNRSSPSKPAAHEDK